MILGSVVSAGQEACDQQLEALGRELTEAIERAKNLARSCKIGNY